MVMSASPAVAVFIFGPSSLMAAMMVDLDVSVSVLPMFDALFLRVDVTAGGFK